MLCCKSRNPADSRNLDCLPHSAQRYNYDGRFPPRVLVLRVGAMAGLSSESITMKSAQGIPGGSGVSGPGKGTAGRAKGGGNGGRYQPHKQEPRSVANTPDIGENIV